MFLIWRRYCTADAGSSPFLPDRKLSIIHGGASWAALRVGRLGRPARSPDL